MRNLFRMLSHEYGITILISSHIISEIELIADTIGVIHKGRLIEEVSLNEVRKEQSKYIEVEVNDSNKAAFVLDNEMQLKNFKVLPNNCIRIYDESIETASVSKVLVSKNIDVLAISKKNQTLEDYFINLIDGGDISA